MRREIQIFWLIHKPTMWCLYWCIMWLDLIGTYNQRLIVNHGHCMWRDLFLFCLKQSDMFIFYDIHTHVNEHCIYYAILHMTLYSLGKGIYDICISFFFSLPNQSIPHLNGKSIVIWLLQSMLHTELIFLVLTHFKKD